MQTKEIDTSIKRKSNILILADYSEGNKAAIHFAMRYLYRPGSLIHIIQTWQKTNFGSSMVRDLSPMLEGIANSELGSLKSHLQNRYSMPDNQIRLIPFEGDLSAYFKTESYQSQEWQIVMGSRNYEKLFPNKNRMNELIDQVSQDLFVLVGLEDNNAISEIFLLADTSETTSSNLSVLKKIAISENPSINVCLSRSFVSAEERRNRVLPLIENCKGTSVTFSQVEKGEGQKEIHEFAKNRRSQLIIFEKNPQRKFQNGIKACLDSWLLKSKGIRV
ncbi:hypothetical protein [Ancylomarina sp.]|uniref:hypothetical protein n=1 Tax=Ancylomarina sp. TaxID=1970196 RepID=UPI00356A21B2